MLGKTLNNIGTICYERGDYAKATSYFQKSIKIKQDIGDLSGASIILNNRACIYKEQADYAKALEHYQKSLEQLEIFEDKDGVAGLPGNISQIQTAMGRHTEGRRSATRSLEIARTIESKARIVDATRALYRADSALGNWRGAFDALLLYKQYSDSLKNDEKSKEFGRIEAKFEFEKQAEAEAATTCNTCTSLQAWSPCSAASPSWGGSASPRIQEVAIFAGVLIVFEFLLVLSDPWIDDYSEGIPIYKLGFNTLIAFVFAPVHHWFMRTLRGRIMQRDDTPPM